MEVINYDIDRHPLIDDLDPGTLIFFYEGDVESESLLKRLADLGDVYDMSDTPTILYMVDVTDNTDVESDFDIAEFPAVTVLDYSGKHEIHTGRHACLTFMSEQLL